MRSARLTRYCPSCIPSTIQSLHSWRAIKALCVCVCVCVCVYVLCFSTRTSEHFSDNNNKKCFTHREKNSGRKRPGSIKQDYIQKIQAIDRSTVTDAHLRLSYQLYRKEKENGDTKNKELPTNSFASEQITGSQESLYWHQYLWLY